MNFEHMPLKKAFWRFIWPSVIAQWIIDGIEMPFLFYGRAGYDKVMPYVWVYEDFLGLDMPKWVLLLLIGLVTPPVGMCLNTCNKINGMSVTRIAKGALPFIVCNILVLLGTTFIPAMADWLPTMLHY